MRRWPLFAAVAYVGLVAVGLFIVPAPPGVGASGQALIAYAARHGGGVRAVTWLGAVSLLPFSLVVARLRQVVRAPGRDVLLLGAVGILGATIVWTWFGAGVALHPDHLTPATARTLADVSAYFGPTLTVMVVLLAAPVGVAAVAPGAALPRWLAAVTAVLVGEQLLETATIFGRSSVLAPGGTLNTYVGPALYLIWILAAGAATSAAYDLAPTRTDTDNAPL